MRVTTHKIPYCTVATENVGKMLIHETVRNYIIIAVKFLVI